MTFATYKKPKRQWETYHRWCLKCGKLFPSETKWRRVCDKCNENQIYKYLRARGCKSKPSILRQINPCMKPMKGGIN